MVFIVYFTLHLTIARQKFLCLNGQVITRSSWLSVTQFFSCQIHQTPLRQQLQGYDFLTKLLHPQDAYNSLHHRISYTLTFKLIKTLNMSMSKTLESTYTLCAEILASKFIRYISYFIFS